MSGLSTAYFEVPFVRQPPRCLITNIRQRILHSVDSGGAWGGSPKIVFGNRLPKIPGAILGAIPGQFPVI